MTEDFLKDLETAKARRITLLRRYLRGQWTITIGIAASGCLMALAGNEAFTGSIIATPMSQVICGLTAAILAALNQAINPGAKVEYHKLGRKALEGIEDAVKYWNIPPQDLVKIRMAERTSPQRAIEMLENIKP